MTEQTQIRMNEPWLDNRCDECKRLRDEVNAAWYAFMRPNLSARDVEDREELANRAINAERAHWNTENRRPGRPYRMIPTADREVTK